MGRARIAGGAGVVLLTGVLLTGCAPQVAAPDAAASGEAIIDSAEALVLYHSFAYAVVGALEASYPAVEWDAVPDARLHASDDGDCLVSVGPIDAAASIVDAAGSWEELESTLEPVLAPADFGPLTEVDSAGGWRTARSTDPDAAALTLRDKGRSELLIRVPVLDTTC